MNNALRSKNAANEKPTFIRYLPSLGVCAANARSPAIISVGTEFIADLPRTRMLWTNQGLTAKTPFTEISIFDSNTWPSAPNGLPNWQMSMPVVVGGSVYGLSWMTPLFNESLNPILLGLLDVGLTSARVALRLSGTTIHEWTSKADGTTHLHHRPILDVVDVEGCA